jgi:hypothetical protein
MPVFSKRQISDAELDSIVRYVEYVKHPDDRGGWALAHVGPGAGGARPPGRRDRLDPRDHARRSGRGSNA